MDNKISKILKCIKKPRMILYYLDKFGFIRIDDKRYLEIIYEEEIGEKLNIKNPCNFSEKLQWLKLNDRNPEYIKMVDKYEVKKYVSNIIGEEFVIPTLGLYNNFREIEFDKLPNQFVIKCTHDSGGIVICKNKLKFDKLKARRKINKNLRRNYFYIGREWPYKEVKPRIIIEKYMEDESKKELKDYKVFCFNGKAKYIQVDFNRFKGHKKNIYDTNWKLTDIQFNYPNDKKTKIMKPKKLDLMIEMAERLAKNKPFVRVDFYSIESKIYFGEITFYPTSGFGKFKPERYNKIFGDLIKLPNI